MIHSRGLLLALILGLPAVGCRQSDNSVVGRWQRTNQPSEWFQFEHDNTFTAGSYGLDTSVLRGSFAQRGTTVTVTSKYGHTRTLELGDSLMVMDMYGMPSHRRSSRLSRSWLRVPQPTES